MAGDLSVRPAMEEDCELLWRWVNDSVVRASALNDSEIEWPAHVEWYRARLRDPRCVLRIVTEADGTPIGQFRLDRDVAGGAELDISIALEARGKGYAPQALRLAIRVASEEGVGQVRAIVKESNPASLRSFRRAGFHFRRWDIARGHRVAIFSKRCTGSDATGAA